MAAAAPPAPGPRRPTPQAWVMIVSLGAVLLVAFLAALLRFGVLTQPGRLLVEAQVNGLSLGRIGKLRIEGLQGDVFRDFSVRRLTITDAKGVWLDARNVAIRWRYLELLGRRVHVDDLTARQVTLVRRPVLGPSHKGGPSPVAIQVDQARARVEMTPDFAYRRGVYDVATRLTVERSNAVEGVAALKSVLHPGDYLNADFDLGGKAAFRFNAEAREAQGGALAGALGLAADQPFQLSAHLNGTTSKGDFTVLTRVGATTPLYGAGAWNPQGGEGHGRLDLTASRLTTGYARRFGPEARFDVAGRKAADGFYALNLGAAAENVQAVAAGEADIGRRVTGPGGLALALRIVDANRILSWPKLGGARLDGRLTGTSARWAIDGKATIEKPGLPDFALATLSGPFRVERGKGQTTLTASAKGEGGAGRGLLAALLGARPSASAELVWMDRDGLLMRKLLVEAPGLKVTGSGEHSLFGGLAFKGDMTVSNLAAAHAGAHGVVKASWSASQAPGEHRPWTFAFDAKGDALAAGFGEIDRLIGQTPRLQAKGDYLDGAIHVAQSNLDGAAGAFGAVGQIGPSAALKLALTWKADGPFTIGPLEMAGSAKGGGSISGTLDNPRADLAADFAQLDLPYLPLRDAHVDLAFLKGPADTNGRLAVTGTSPYGAARGASAFRFVDGGVDLSGIDVAGGGVSAQGSLALRRGQASSADLALAVGPGAFLSQGAANGRLRIADAPGGAHAALDLDATNAALRSGGVAVRSLKLTADGPLARLPYQVKADGVTTGGPWRLAGSGAFTTLGSDTAFTFDGAGRVRRADFRTLAPAELRFGDRGTTARLQLALGGGKADIDWRQMPEGLAASGTLSNVSLGLLDQDFVGRFDADFHLGGKGQALAGTLQARLAGAGGRDLKGAAPLDGLVSAHLAGDQLVVDASLGSDQGLTSKAHVVLPTEASAAPFRIALVSTRPMSGHFDLNGEIKPVWDLLMGSERSVSGKITAQGELRGTLRDPSAVGTASLDDGRFTDSETGLKLQNVTLRAALENNAVDVSQFTGSDGLGGQVSGGGRINLSREGASSLRLNLKSFRLIDNEIATASASGQATMDRAADGKIRLTGALTIDRADIAANPPVPSGVVPMDVIEINKPVDLQAAIEGPPDRSAPIALDVTLKAPSRVFVKGRGLNVELSLDSHVGGTSNGPILTGVARVVRGDYDFAGKRFQFDNRGVVYLGATAQAIRLDLTAVRDDPALTAVIRIQGTAAKPKITLTSTPVLPQDEVLSQVLFGASASQLSAGEAAQLASAVSALASGGGFDIIGGLRSFARLDRLAFGGDAAGGMTVSGGKYLTDNVYLEVTGGGREGAATSVEWRVKKNLSFISRLTRQGDTRLSVRWRKDY